MFVTPKCPDGIFKGGNFWFGPFVYVLEKVFTLKLFIGALNILQRLLRKKESLGLKASKILSVVNALWQKKAM